MTLVEEALSSFRDGCESGRHVPPDFSGLSRQTVRGTVGAPQECKQSAELAQYEVRAVYAFEGSMNF
jgi:hypothetical protein